MAKSVSDYQYALKSLMPKGRAWSGLLVGRFFSLLGGMAIEFNRLETRVDDLQKEINPNFSNELLSDWEKMMGLPDETTPVNRVQTAQERRAAIISKLSSRGGCSKQFYKNLAKKLGYEIEIIDYKKFKSGKSMCGDKIYTDPWNHWFKVISPYSSKQVFRSGQSRSGEKLRTFENDQIESTFLKRKHSETQVFFEYTE